MAENELYQRRTVRSERVPACETGSKISPAILTLGFVYDLSRSLSVNPNVYYTDGNLMVAVMFSGSSFGCDDFMEEYRDTMADISAKWPLTVYGNVPGPETGELCARREGDEVVSYKKCVSGRDFSDFSDICIKVEPNDLEECSFLKEGITQMCSANRCIALPREYERFCVTSEFYVPIEGTHFSYLPMEGDVSCEERLRCLCVNQKEELWHEFLKYKMTAMEFEWLWDAYQDGTVNGLLEWELALESTLSRLNVKVTNDNQVFRVFDRNDMPMRFDYVHGSAADKVFLKILFPLRCDVI